MGWAERANPNSLRNLARWEREGAMRNAAEKKEGIENMKRQIREFVRAGGRGRKRITIPIPKENRASMNISPPKFPPPDVGFDSGPKKVDV